MQTNPHVRNPDFIHTAHILPLHFSVSAFRILAFTPIPVSDVWNFAATLYHLLTGKFTYRFDNLN